MAGDSGEAAPGPGARSALSTACAPRTTAQYRKRRRSIAKLSTAHRPAILSSPLAPYLQLPISNSSHPSRAFISPNPLSFLAPDELGVGAADERRERFERGGKLAGLALQSVGEVMKGLLRARHHGQDAYNCFADDGCPMVLEAGVHARRQIAEPTESGCRTPQTFPPLWQSRGWYRQARYQYRASRSSRIGRHAECDVSTGDRVAAA
eukprot:3776769-Rhodomonas_salina.3